MACCEKSDLKATVREKYGRIASAEQQGCGCCSDGVALDHYSVFKDDYSGLAGYVPEADLHLGCGLPTEFAGIETGDTVIDLGSGAGNDCFVARHLVGEMGWVIGVDMTPQMVERARKNAETLGFENVRFQIGEIEHLPVSDQLADVVISNCVINLVPDKRRAFQEVIRVLKPGGHFCISDVVTEGQIPAGLLEQAELYAGCVAGALPLEEYVGLVRSVGFVSVEVKKKKMIDIPEALLNEFLTPSELDLFRESGVGIHSITLTGEKPACRCGCKG